MSSTVVIEVDSCSYCSKKIRKALCVLSGKFTITSIAFDEKKNTFKVSGPFNTETFIKKIRCLAGKVIVNIYVELTPQKPDKPTPPPPPQPQKVEVKILEWPCVKPCPSSPCSKTCCKPCCKPPSPCSKTCCKPCCKPPSPCSKTCCKPPSPCSKTCCKPSNPCSKPCSPCSKPCRSRPCSCGHCVDPFPSGCYLFDQEYITIVNDPSYGCSIM